MAIKQVTNVVTSEQITIPFKKIFFPDYNHRHDLPNIVGLAEDLKDNGQLTPIIVSNGGTKDKPYILRAGRRRCAAWEHNGWVDREILAIVRHYAPGDHLAPLVDMRTENIEREGVSAFDDAEFIYRLSAGTYWVPKGETASPVDKKVISVRFRIDTSHVGKLIKIYKNLDIEVVKLVRKSQAPLRLLIILANIEGENKKDKQLEMFNNWIEQKKELENLGRKRAERKDKGKKKNTEEKPEVAEESNENIEEEEINFIPPIDRRKKIGIKESSFYRRVEDYLTILMVKHRAKSILPHDKVRLEGMIDVFRFMTGEVKKLPGLNVSDFNILNVEDDKNNE